MNKRNEEKELQKIFLAIERERQKQLLTRAKEILIEEERAKLDKCRKELFRMGGSASAEDLIQVGWEVDLLMQRINALYHQCCPEQASDEIPF